MRRPMPGSREATVVGVFSRDPARARSAASICKAEPFTDATALMASVDAIDVCLPSAIHHAFVVPALDAGKHVFCETPLALELDEARQMRDAARRADRLLQVGLLMRSLGAYRAHQGGHVFGRARTPAERRDLAAGVLSPPGCARSQGALRRSLDRADDLRLRFHPVADGPARPSVGQRGAKPAGRGGRDHRPPALPGRPSCHRDRQRPDAAGLSLLGRLSRAVRTCGLRSPRRLRKRRPAEKHLHDLQRQGAGRACTGAARAIPIRSNCNASWIASTVAPIRSFWTSSGRSKP